MKLTPISSTAIVSLLNYFGYVKVRQRGSHVVTVNGNGKIIVVPVHSKKIGIGLLRAIIRELGITREAYSEALEKL